MRSGHVKGIYMFYGYDGTYEVSKKKYSTVYDQPIIMTKTCPTHHVSSIRDQIFLKKSIVIPKGQIGSSLIDYALDELKTKCCQYSFTLNGDANLNYTIEMAAEHVRYCDDEMFCHVATDFGRETSVLRASFHDRIDDILRLRVPPMNLAATTNPEQFLSKIQLYTTFS